LSAHSSTGSGMINNKAISDEIMRHVLECGHGKTLCPSQVARSLSRAEDEWRALMPWIREVATALAIEGMIMVTQQGVPVDLQKAKGPVRLGLASNGVSR